MDRTSKMCLIILFVINFVILGILLMPKPKTIYYRDEVKVIKGFYTGKQGVVLHEEDYHFGKQYDVMLRDGERFLFNITVPSSYLEVIEKE